MIDDYRKWKAQNASFIASLKEHDSIIYHRVHNVFNALDYIADINEDELNDDYYAIFTPGYQFIGETIGEARIYLEKYFEGNLNTFLEYEPLINYVLYLNDLKNTLLEHDYMTKEVSDEFSAIGDEIENILLKQKPYTDLYIKEIDLRVTSSFQNKKEYLATHDVYDIIAEEFQNIKDKETAAKISKNK